MERDNETNESREKSTELPPISWKMLQEGRKTACGIGSSPGQLPPWLDREEFYRGQRACRENFAVFYLGLVVSLTLSFTENHIYEIFSQVPSHESSRAMAKRFHGSLVFLTKCLDLDLLDPKSEGHQSVLAIRSKHKVYNRILQKKLGAHPEGHHWISQTYMAGVQLSLMCPIYFEPYGISYASNDDLKAITHFWRVLGYMLGTSDRYNPCRDGLPGLRRVNKEMIEDLLIPSTLAMTSQVKVFIQTLCDSMFATFFFPLPTFKPTMHIATNVLNNIGLSTPKLTAVESLTWAESLCVKAITLAFRSGIYTWTPVRKLANAIMRWTVTRGPSQGLSDEPYGLKTISDERFICPISTKSI